MSTNSFPLRLVRIGSMLLDHAAMSLVFGIIIGPVLVFQIVEGYEGHPATMGDGFGSFKYLFGVAYAIYILKDGIEGRSPAKLLTKFQVVRAQTGEIAGPIRCCIRNLFIIVWPLEVVVTFFSPQKRLGDFVAGTRTIQSEQVNRKPQIKWRELVIGFIIAYAVSLAFLIGMEYLLFSVI